MCGDDFSDLPMKKAPYCFKDNRTSCAGEIVILGCRHLAGPYTCAVCSSSMISFARIVGRSKVSTNVNPSSILLLAVTHDSFEPATSMLKIHAKRASLSRLQNTSNKSGFFLSSSPILTKTSVQRAFSDFGPNCHF